MPVPLNASTEAVRAFLTKLVGFTVDDSLPFLTPTGSQSDMDFIAVHPTQPPKMILPDGRKVELKRCIAVEVKGWPDSRDIDTTVFNELQNDLNQLESAQTQYIPSADWSRLYYGFFSQPAYDFAAKRFGTNDFQRLVFITPKPRASKYAKLPLEGLLDGFAQRRIYFVWIDDVLTTLFQYAKESQYDSRRNMTLELMRYLQIAGFNPPMNAQVIRFEFPSLPEDP